MTAQASSSKPSSVFGPEYPASRLCGTLKGRTPILSLSGLTSLSTVAVVATGDDSTAPSTWPGACLPPVVGLPRLLVVLFLNAPPGPLEKRLSFRSGGITFNTSDKSAFPSSSSPISSSPPKRTLFFRPAAGIRPNFSSRRFIMRKISPSRTPRVRSVWALISGKIDSSI